MRNNIPPEMRGLRQWVCAYADKIPLNPLTGKAASVSDPYSWGSFEEALLTGLPHIGFVLTEADPYTIIDLDNKPDHPLTPEQWAVHEKILNALDTYTERSASGRGYHIVVRGSVPAGLHRDNVEVYSSARYMICTGAVVRPSPIAEGQDLLDALTLQMQPAKEVALVEEDGLLEDDALLEMALRADNGEKFNELCKGDWAAMGYPSQSEADFALLSILAFYTPDNEQVRRLFRMSGLGQRPKANDGRYLDRALRKIRAKQPAHVEVDLTRMLGQAKQEEPVEVTSVELGPNEGEGDEKQNSEPVALQFPPGLTGTIAAYIYQTSIRPVAAVSIAAALSLMAGIGGRAYNISGSGLNHYIILLAKTGSGKEGATSGIDRLLSEVRKTVPMVDSYLGPSMFASGQALIKVLDERPCFVSVLGEFGLILRQLCDPRANAAQVMLKRVLLDLYGKSGWTAILRSSVYADKEKNTKIIQAPAVTILGESTPEAFFDGLDSSHIAEGLIPRFILLEYKGPRPPRNPNTNTPPNPFLVSQLAEYSANCLTVSNNHNCIPVQLDPDALELMTQFDHKADAIINNGSSDVELQLWNRAHLKALKLAALIATGCNPYAPIVDGAIATWAIDLVTREIGGVATRYSDGEVGTGDHRCEHEIRRMIAEYLKMSPARRRTYGSPKSIQDKPIVPYTYLYRRGRLLTTFKLDRRGSSKAMVESLANMVKCGELDKVSGLQARRDFGLSTDLYVVGQSW